VPNLIHLRRTDETLISLQYLLVRWNSSLDEIVIHKFPLILRSTYHFTAYIPVAVFPLLKKQQSWAHCVDNSLDFDLLQTRPLFNIVKQKLVWLVIDCYATVGLARIGRCFSDVHLLHRTQVRVFETGSFSYYGSKIFDLFGTNLKSESKFPLESLSNDSIAV
jgi:hypothetical protein